MGYVCDSLTSKKPSWRCARARCSSQVNRVISFLPTVSELAQSSGGEERTSGTDVQNTPQQPGRHQEETLGSVGLQSDSMKCAKESEDCRLN